LFVVFEGADGCGKTTHARLLVERFRSQSRSVETLAFPRRVSDVGMLARRHLEDEVVLFEWTNYEGWGGEPSCCPGGNLLVFQALNVADKFDAAPDVAEWLDAGKVVVSSRWGQSAVVYGAVMGLDERRTQRMVSFLPRPHLNVLLTLTEEATLARRPDLSDRIERDRDGQARVRQKYLDIWAVKKELAPREWVVVDAGGSVEDVHERVWEAVGGVLVGGSPCELGVVESGTVVWSLDVVGGRLRRLVVAESRAGCFHAVGSDGWNDWYASSQEGKTWERDVSTSKICEVRRCV
jgi:dTMP kinase